MVHATKSLSGHAYVPVRLKEEDVTVKPAPVRIFDQKNCEHATTICVECADQWDLDWIIFYDRTAGGRRLKAALDTKQPVQSS